MVDLVDQVLAERRRQTAGPGFLGGLIGASLLHLGLVLAFILAPTSENKAPTEYVNVRVVPLAALGTPKPRPAPVERKPEPPAEVVKPPTPEPPPDPAPRAVAPALPQAKPRPEPQRPAAADEPSAGEEAPQERLGSPQGNVAGASPFGSTALEGIDPDFTYDYYLDRMLALIHAQWTRPPTEGDVKVVLRFSVQKSGEIADLELAEPSGFNAFDLAALRAVQNASPLPRLPASYRRDSLQVTLIVR